MGASELLSSCPSTRNSRVTDRFFLSTTQLRGFEYRGLGPRDLGAANEDALGGNYYAVARFEADFPLGIPEEYGISGGVFLDVGSLWGLDNTAGAIQLVRANGGIPELLDVVGYGAAVPAPAAAPTATVEGTVRPGGCRGHA